MECTASDVSAITLSASIALSRLLAKAEALSAGIFATMMQNMTPAACVWLVLSNVDKCATASCALSSDAGGNTLPQSCSNTGKLLEETGLATQPWIC